MPYGMLLATSSVASLACIASPSARCQSKAVVSRGGPSRRTVRAQATSRSQQDIAVQQQGRQPGEDAERRGRGGLGDLLGPIGLTLGGNIGKEVRAAPLCLS